MMTLAPKFDRRTMLAADPKSFNELLDLFRTYVATIGPPIHTGTDMLREEIGAGEHTALGHIFGVVCDAEDMAKRLSQIRAARNTGSDVAITLTRHDAILLEEAIRTSDRMLSAAGSALELLNDRADVDSDNEDAGARAVMTLAQRALMDTDEREMARLRRFAEHLRDASQYQNFDQEEAA